MNRAELPRLSKPIAVSALTGLAAIALIGVGAPSGVTAPTGRASLNPAPAAAAGLPLKGMRVTIDPGHNGANYTRPSFINHKVFIGNQWKSCDTTGTQTPGGYRESEMTWDVATRLTAILRARGASVGLTRHSNAGVGPCNIDRAKIGNRMRANAAISLHGDGGPPAGRGFHVIMPALLMRYTDDIFGSSRRLGYAVRDAYRKGTGLPHATYVGGGTGTSVRNDLGGLNLSDVPKVFIEMGNMRNQTDARLLSSPSFRQRAAEALASGISRFLSNR